eukprot:gene8140-11019_t
MKTVKTSSGSGVTAASGNINGNSNVTSSSNNIYATGAGKVSTYTALFDHLPRRTFKRGSNNSNNISSVEGERILHPATIKLGGLYYTGKIFEDDDRVVALVAAIVNIMADYKTPPSKILREDMDRYLGKQIQHIVDCRPLCKGMGNFIKFVRHIISQIPPDINESEAKSILLSKLQNFLDDRIIYAAESISTNISSLIRDNDVILTFGSSPLIRKVLLTASKTKKFRVVVIDTRPLNEGLVTLTSLSHTIQCVYSPLSGAAAAMKDVTRVVLGASCLLSNGSMLAPAGTAMVAALAKAQQIPVIVASESYKFSEKVQLDSIVFNELGNANEIAQMSTFSPDGASLPAPQPTPQLKCAYLGGADAISGSDTTNENFDENCVSIPESVHGSTIVALSSSTKMPFAIVNLRYDLTPIANISVVATETGLIPPTSIPVLIREMQSEQPVVSPAEEEEDEVRQYHFSMLNDNIRNRAYFEALRQVITNKSRVLDIGSGTALLSMMSSQLGAEYVLGVEGNPILAQISDEILKINNFSDDKINIYDGMSYELELGTKYLSTQADVVVSETLDSWVIEEGFLVSLHDAKSRNLITPSAVVIPNQALLYCQLVETVFSLSSFPAMVEGFNLEPIRKLRKSYRNFVAQHTDFVLKNLSEPIPVFNFQFQDMDISTALFNYTLLNIPITQNGTLHGLVCWFNLTLDPKGFITLSNNPGSKSHWMQMFKLLEGDDAVVAGEEYKIQIAHTGEKYMIGNAQYSSRLIHILSSCQYHVDIFSSFTSSRNAAMPDEQSYVCSVEASRNRINQIENKIVRGYFGQTFYAYIPNIPSFVQKFKIPNKKEFESTIKLFEFHISCP